MTESMTSKLARIARACVENDNEALQDGTSLHVYLFFDLWVLEHGFKAVMCKVDEFAGIAWFGMDPRSVAECFAAMQKIQHAFGMATPSDEFFEIALHETERFRRPRDCECAHLMERSLGCKAHKCETVLVAMFLVQDRVSPQAARWLARALCCKKCR